MVLLTSHMSEDNRLSLSHNYEQERKKQKPMASRFCDLPETVVVEIMSWLPPNSLIRCKSVQKSWHALIDTLIKSRWFVAKHLKNSGSRSSFMLFLGELWYLTNPGGDLHNVITDIQLVNSYKLCNGRIQFDCVELSSTTRAIHVKASYSTSQCDGIIFQTDKFTNKIMICNPTTREFKYLDPDSSCFFGSKFKTCMAGFGYDPIANVYKVIRVVSQGASFGAEVCTLGTSQGDSSSWREIRMINIGNYFRTYAGCGVYHRGFLYWSLRHENKGSPVVRMIISFDMHSEEFRIVPLPSGVVNNPMEFETPAFGQHSVTKVLMELVLGVWNESITLLKFVAATIPWEAEGVARPMEVWKMKTESESDSSSSSSSSSSSCGHERFSCWVNHPTFYPPLKRFYPKTFWNGDELLLCTCAVCRTVSYNLRTGEVRNVQLHPRKAYTFLDALVCAKSLVSFNN